MRALQALGTAEAELADGGGAGVGGTHPAGTGLGKKAGLAPPRENQASPSGHVAQPG